MKRKILLVLLVWMMMLSLAGCGESSNNVESYYDDDGNFVIESDGWNSVLTSTLPVSIPYNGNSIPVIDVSFYQDCVNYSYTLFVVTTLDVSSLSDADLYWLRESDLDVRVYITSEANDYDFDSAVPLGSLLYTDTNKLIFVETSSFYKENRKSFVGSEVSVCIDVKQEETYEYLKDNGETSDLNKTESVTYEGTVGNAVLGTGTISGPLHEYIYEWLELKQ